jgi:signal transduction histidine kinase
MPRLLVTRLATHPIAQCFCIGIVGFADYVTKWEISLGAFYLIPILVMAYFHSRVLVLLALTLSTAAWLSVDLLTHPTYSLSWIPYWNAAVRMIMFGVAGFLLLQIRTLRAREKRFMHFIVHDLRSPLTALGLAVERLATLHTDSQSNAIIRNCEHVLRRSRDILDSLLNLAKIESGFAKTRQVPFSLTSTLESVQGTMQSILEQFNVRVERPQTPENAVVLGDPQLTERVIENILGNALKVSPPGGVICIQLEPTEDQSLHLCITDQGPGIPSHMREAVFDPFMQASASSSSCLDGVGLGLAFCRSALQAQGGRIWIECPPGGGTIVNMVLPCAKLDRN